MKNYYLIKGILPVFLLLISCAKDEPIQQKKEFLITKVSTVDEDQLEYNNVDQVWEYEYDNNDKLINVFQYHPSDKHKIVFNLIYDIEGDLIKIKSNQNEFDVLNEEGKVSLFGMGNDVKNYYYNADRFIIRTEEVFVGYNTNFRNYYHNEKGQLFRVEEGTDGIVDYKGLFMDFDNSEVSFQFFDMFPTQDFIIAYAFNLKYNGLGKPFSWDNGYFEYDVDNNGNILELKKFHEFNNIVEAVTGMRFEYKEKLDK